LKLSLIRIISLILILTFLSGMGNGFAVSASMIYDDLIVKFSPLPTPVMLMSASNEVSYDWHYDGIEYPALPLFNLTGKGMRIGVIDSGISPHKDIPESKIVARKSFADSEITEDVYTGIGHGTAVAAILIGQGEIGEGVRGIAPDAEIVNARIINENLTGSMRDAADAVVYCVEQGCDIINLSFGTQEPLEYDYTAYTVLMELYDAIAWAVENGCIVVAAAGNAGDAEAEEDFISYPAGFDNVICVGATAFSENSAWFTQKNASVDFCAPGEAFRVASKTSESSYAIGSGTSFSAPIVSGIAALIKEANPNATQTDVINILKATVKDVGTSGYDFGTGYGLVNGKNLAKKLRNSDFYAYLDKDGKAYAANIGEDRDVLSFAAEYSGGRNNSITDLSFFLESMKRKELDLPESNAKMFFWADDSLTPLCGNLQR